MKRQKTMLLAVAIVATVLTINPQAMAVTCSKSYSDGLSCGVCDCPLSATMTQAATVKVVESEQCPWCNCYHAEIDKVYEFSYACSITLPKVGEIYNGGLFDQTFHDTTKIHEDWHYNYMVALAGATYGRLETWSASYASSCCPCSRTPATARTLGNTDLANALTTAQNAFDKDFNTDLTFETAAGSGCHVVKINNVDTWRSVNWDWGQEAVNYANGITVNFTKGPGDCTCSPQAHKLLISVNGVPTTPYDTGIYLMPSDTIRLGVYAPDGYVPGGPGDKYWGLVCNPDCATISGGVVMMPPAPDASAILTDDMSGLFGNPGVYGFIGSWSSSMAPAGIYFDEIILHCESLNGPTTVSLISTLDFETYVLEDTVIIEQVPEPATMFLLGLGGLMMLRRRR